MLVYKGELKVGKEGLKRIRINEGGVFEQNKVEDEFVELQSVAEQSQFLILAGKPLNEPIAQRGPFVMNTQEELQEAINDYYYGRNGFEGAQGWKSKISKLKEEF